MMILKCLIPLADFVLDVDAASDARITCVFGPSGSGKTTLLDAAAGLREIQSGEIVINGRVLFSSTRKVNLSPQDRSIGYVPQETALFPHLSVRKNILYGAGRKPSNPDSDTGLDHVIQLLEIGHLLDRRVRSLSGGESQRVALARALLSRPQFLLLDEPLASLDVGLKERIIPYLRRVRDEFGIPMVYVTHDPVEVLSLADWVIMIREGRLVAQGIPREVLMSSMVLSQLEKDQLENVFDAVLIDSDSKGGRNRVRLKSGLELFIPYATGPANRPLQIGIRGDDILVATKAPDGISAGNIFRGVVRNIERAGGQAILRVEAGEAFYVRLTSSAVERLGLATGGEVYLIIKTRSCILL
jgi:molybdate transport system ATP-binding protein